MKKILILTTIIAFIGISLIAIYNDPSICTYIEEIEVQLGNKTYHLLTYNFADYFENIKNTVSSPTMLKIEMIPQTWQMPSGSWLEPDFWEAILNNLEFMVNVGIFALNILLYPLRIWTYLGRTVLALIGVNRNSNSISWIFQLIETFYGQLPYLDHTR